VNEEWRPVVGLEGWYSVSNTGHVRREAYVRVDGRPFRQRREVKRHPNKKGYWQVRMYGPPGARTYAVHQVVAAAFIGPKPDGFTVNHINGIKTDNRPENLEYLTSADNHAHAVRLGLHTHGTRHNRSKVTEEQVRWIRHMHSSQRLSTVDLGWLFDIASTNISRIVRGVNYSRVE
jgi:hypothetical protein